MEKMIGEKRQSEVLCDVIRGMEYGEQITHTTISGIIGEKAGGTKYYSVIQKARKMLLEDYKVCLENVREIGYRVTMPDDFVKVSLNEYKSGFKRIKKGASVLQNAPVENMSEEGREAHRHVYDRTVQLDAFLNGVNVELKTLANKKPHPFAVAALQKQR